METNTLTKINIFNLDYETSMDVLQKYEEILVSLSIPTNNDDNKNDESETEEIDVNILKKMVVKWIKLDDTIKEYNKEIKDFKSEKSQLEEKILSFMNKNEQNEIPVKDGKIEKKISESKEPINEEYIKKCLIKTFDDVELVDKLTTEIMNNRLVKESYRLSRKSTKTDSKKKITANNSRKKN